MESGIIIIIRRTRDTRYSVSSLVAALDVELQGLPVNVVIADSFDKVLDIIGRRPDRIKIVAYSLLTTQLPKMLSEITYLNNKAKPSMKNLLTVVGGPHASGDPVGSIKLGFDYVFIGEAEESLPAFIRSLFEGEDPIEKVSGILTRRDGEYVFTGRAKYVDLNKFPPFAYWRNLFSPIEITRGCPFGCKYCQVSIMHGARPRHRSLKNVLKYSEILLKSGRKDLRFISPNAFSYLGDGLKLNVDGLCGLVESLHKLARSFGGRFFLGTFPSEVRPEHAAEEDVVKCISGKVSNKRIIIGAQSGSERVLKAINRGHDVNDVLNAVYVLNKYGFEVDIDFILGLPPEEYEDMEKSIKLMELLVSRFRARIHAHYYLPLPGSPFDVAEPRPIPIPLRKRLFKLLGRGRLYGDWLRQERLSREIVSLWRAGIIKGLRGLREVKIKKP